MVTTDSLTGPTPYVLDDFKLEHAGDVVENGRTIHRIVAVEKAPRRPEFGPLTATTHLEDDLVESLSPVVRFSEKHRASIERTIMRAANEVFAATRHGSVA